MNNLVARAYLPATRQHGGTRLALRCAFILMKLLRNATQFAPWREPGVYEQAIEVIEGFENDPAHDGDLVVEFDRRAVVTLKMMIASRAKRLEEFRRFYKSLDGAPDEKIIAS